MAVVESSTVGVEAPEVEEDRWPLLPDNTLYLENSAPLMPSQVVRTDEALRRAAIAETTDVEALRRIIRAELRLQNPRQEVVAMCNQQKDRLETVGFAEGYDADE